MTATSISHSEVETYLQCRRKHLYRYERGLKPRESGKALAYGSAGHRVLEAFYATIIEEAGTKNRRAQRKAFDAALSAAYEAFRDVIREGWEQPDDRADLHDSLFKYYFPNEPFVKRGYLVEQVELRQVLEYDTEHELQIPFVIDLVVVDPKQKRAIVDHKFKYDFIDSDLAGLLPQLPKYVGATRALNVKADYAIYNQIRTRKIGGTVMKKAELVEALTNKLGYDTIEFEDSDKPVALAKLTVPELQQIASEEGIVYKTGPTLEQAMDLLPIKPNAIRVQRTFVEQMGVAAEIQSRRLLPLEVRDQTAFRAANEQACKNCDYRELCEMELIGANTALLMATEFETREERRLAEEVD